MLDSANIKDLDMVTWENKAWLALGSMCPPYLAYFAIQLASPAWLDTMVERILCLAVAALTHAAAFGIGLLLLRRQREDGLAIDERDLAIDARATRSAYWLLFAGAVVVGMMMPFRDGGWRIVNATLAVLILAEALRNMSIVAGYREGPRFAH
jgi:uncharacterized membrane protein